MARNRSLAAAAAGLAAAAFVGLQTPAWAAVPEVPEVLRISTGPYAGFQFCGAPTPPTFGTAGSFAPTFAASVRGVEPRPGLDGTVELARPGEAAFRTLQVSTGPVGHDWIFPVPTSTFSTTGDYRWRIRAENTDGASAWSPWCTFTVTAPATAS